MLVSKQRRPSFVPTYVPHQGQFLTIFGHLTTHSAASSGGPPRTMNSIIRGEAKLGTERPKAGRTTHLNGVITSKTRLPHNTSYRA